MRHFCHLVVLVLVFNALQVSAQYDDEPKTIKLKKESNLSKAQFDNTQMRLFCVDRFGNARDNQILAFTLHVKTKKGVRSFRGGSNDLTGEMTSYLDKLKDAAKIFFTDITALNEGDHT